MVYGIHALSARNFEKSYDRSLKKMSSFYNVTEFKDVFESLILYYLTQK